MIWLFTQLVDNETLNLDAVGLKIKREPQVEVVWWNTIVAHERIS